MVRQSRICKVEGCYNPFYAKGLCKRHWRQQKETGAIFGNPSRSCRDKNIFTETEDGIQISLFNQRGFFTAYAYIDNEDLQVVQQHKWHLTKKGYVETRNNKKLLKLHQLILNYSSMIDHIDRNKLNNRKKNLRKATVRQNTCNQGISKSNKSGYKGVHQIKSGKFVAQICYRGKTRHIGTFVTKEEAAIAYNTEAVSLNGKFAYLNELTKQKNIT